MGEILDKVNSPADVRKLDKKELPLLCTDIRQYIIQCCSHNPGHIGASLGVVELAVALHYIYNTPEDKIIWDVGHQAYAHKIITGRKEEFKLNRKYKGISGFPKISESEYDAFGTGHSSTSISAAIGIETAQSYLGKNNKIVAVIGDGALTGGMAYEALNHAGALKKDILVILNDNHMSIDKGAGALNNYLFKISTSPTYNKVKNRVWNHLGWPKMKKHLQKILFSTKMAFFKNGAFFESLGFRYFGTIDGNDISQLTDTLEKLKNIQGPKLLHITTKKGKGYKPAEEDQTIWHAPGIFDPDTGARLSSDKNKADKYQTVFGETLLDLAEKNDKIVGITPAMLTGSSLTILQKVHPERVFDVGIAEQHAVTFSAGLAAGGLLPYCNIYSTFLQRAYDSVIHDVALQNLKVVLCIDRAGLVGEDGATHQGAFDIAYLRPIPNITIMSPMNEIELKNMLYSASLPEYKFTAIRYPRGNSVGLNWRNAPYEKIEKGKARLLSDGEDIGILSYGPIGNKVIEAIKVVKQHHPNFNPIHYDMRFIKPIDQKALEHTCAKVSTIITIEDGSIIGGLSNCVSEYVSWHGYCKKIIALGIPDKFIEQGSIDQLQSECKYNTRDLIFEIEKNLKKV